MFQMPTDEVPMSAQTDSTTDRTREAESFLDGQMLIAMPGMSDPRFARSLV